MSDSSAPAARTIPAGPDPATTVHVAAVSLQHAVGAPVPLALGRPGPVRSPQSVFWRCWATLGIYALVMHYRLNDELRTYNPGVQVNPTLAVAAFLIPFGGVVSALHTSERIRRTQVAVGLPSDCGSGTTLALMLVGGSYAYQQSRLNQVWALSGSR